MILLTIIIVCIQQYFMFRKMWLGGWNVFEMLPSASLLAFFIGYFAEKGFL